MKTVVITGANRGIGFAFAQRYQHMGFNVVAVCRKSSDALEALGVEVFSGVDVTDPTSLEPLKEGLIGRNIDILINNAGILRNEVLGSLNFQTIEEQFQANSLGPLRVTEALLPNLSSGSKIALVTSRMGSITDNTSGGRYGYRMSKAALNIAGVSLAHDLKDRGIAVAILHPGYVQTDMVNFGGDISADTAAERLVDRIEELSIETSGTFWHSNGEVLPW